MASDRACIDSNGAVDKVFSPQYLMDCDTQESGCNGAATQRVVGWVAQNGIVTDTCQPYKAVVGTCETKCTNEEKHKLWKFKDDTIWQGTVA